jgi:hypothetical protein
MLWRLQNELFEEKHNVSGYGGGVRKIEVTKKPHCPTAILVKNDVIVSLVPVKVSLVSIGDSYLMGEYIVRHP